MEFDLFVVLEWGSWCAPAGIDLVLENGEHLNDSLGVLVSEVLVFVGILGGVEELDEGRSGEICSGRGAVKCVESIDPGFFRGRRVSVDAFGTAAGS